MKYAMLMALLFVVVATSTADAFCGGIRARRAARQASRANAGVSVGVCANGVCR